MQEFLSADFLKFFIPLATGVIGWLVIEWRRRSWEQYQRKEDRYRELLQTSRGFYVSTQDTELKSAFLDQVNLCWLYCPDEVISRAYSFLETVHVGNQSTDAQQEAAFGELVAAIRRDLFRRGMGRRTRLQASDFRHLKAT